MRPRPRSRDGFTLTELLVVVGILLTLAALSLPALRNLMPASQMEQAAQMVQNGLSYARQVALARNARVEVRFYQVADPEVPGEVLANPASGHYRAFQAFVYSDAGTATPLSKVQYFPRLIIADAGGTLSPLLSGQTKAWSPSDPQPPLPRAGTHYVAQAFAFQPDGSTNLATTQTWFVTLHAKDAGDSRNALPPNYAVLQVDPVNGHLQEYRP